jgi:hypothetical protein
MANDLALAVVRVSVAFLGRSIDGKTKESKTEDDETNMR